MERLLQLQSGLAGGEQAATEESPAAPTDGAPAGGEQPAAAAPGEEAAGGGSQDEPTDLSQDNPNETEEERAAREEAEAEATAAGEAPEGALPAELAELPDDVREELLALAKEVADGKTNFGDLKRGHKLIGKHAEEVDRLHQEIEGLKGKLAEAGSGAAAGPGSQLKTVAAVTEREQRLQKVIDWCEDNPQGGEQNGQEFTAAEVTQMRREARDELKYVLPARKEQLQKQEQQQAVFTEQQQAARSQVLKILPELKDPANPETQHVNEMLTKLPMFKAMFVSPEMAALTWHLGEQAMQERLKKRGIALDTKTGALRPVSRTVQTPKPKIPGQVKTGRPVAGGGTTAAARPGSGPTVAAAKERIAKERSVGGLADLIGAMEPNK